VKKAVNNLAIKEGTAPFKMDSVKKVVKSIMAAKNDFNGSLMAKI